MKLTSRLLVVPCAVCLCYSVAHAQRVPDAGSLLRDQQRATPQPAEFPPRPVQAEKPAPQLRDPGRKLVVKAFRIEGATLIPEAELVDQLKDAIGRELGVRDLQVLALRLVGYYDKKGFLAQVVLPTQEFKDGVLTYRVIEGKRGGLRIDKKGERLDAARIARFIERRVPPGTLINTTELGEALGILNEQPGIFAKSGIAAGKGEGEVDLIIQAEELPLLSYTASASNQGSRGTGTAQAGGAITLNNPSGAFDAAAALVNVSQGATYGRLEYDLGVGDGGARLGGSISQLNYRLTQDTFSALQANGTAGTVGLTASYPLARRPDFSQTVSGSYDSKRLQDLTIAGETGNRRIDVATVGISATLWDTYLRGGASSFGAYLTSGRLDQRNAGALAADQTTRQMQGGYSKITWNLSRVQMLTDKWSVSAAMRGQVAGKNLDSTERFVLGGPNGVRAYPVGEAAADQGWLLALSVGRQINAALGGFFFVDTGNVQLNRNLWTNWNAANPALQNRYSLSGFGAGLDWRIGTRAKLTASIARPMGSNGGRDVNGNDIEGRKSGTRGWLNLTAQF